MMPPCTITNTTDATQNTGTNSAFCCFATSPTGSQRVLSGVLSARAEQQSQDRQAQGPQRLLPHDRSLS